MSKEPVFVSILGEDERFNDLSGKYNFHSIKNKAAAYVREGGKLNFFKPHPYFLCFLQNQWCIQSIDQFKSTDYEKANQFWICVDTQGMKYLNVKKSHYR